MTRKVGGREATTGIIPGDYCLSVGKPAKAPPEGWNWVPLLDVARLESGHTPSRGKPEYWGGDVPWIGIKDATGNHGRVIYDTIQHTNELGIKNSAARILPAGTVCLSRTASVGYVVVMGEPMATSQDFANWVCGPSLDYRFLKYALLADNAALHRFSYGSTHQTIYFPELKAFHVCMPNVAEQTRIADTLQSLDGKIELNRRMSSTLEEMARSLYKSWFVDFDPVHAKMEGRQPAFMDEATAALFPDRSGEDGLPEGWMNGCLGDVAVNPRTGVKPDQIDPSTPYIGLEHMPKRCVTLSEWGTAEDIGSQKSAMQQGDFLFGKLRPYFHKVGISPVSGICSTDIIVVRPAKPLWAGYTLSVISSDDFVEHTNAGSSGTRMPRTNWKDMGRYEIVIPTEQVAQAFENMFAPTRDRIIKGVHEAKTLAALRDSLLPKLMSGELHVREAHEQVEEVA